jgi:hypothetical protein
LYLFSRVSLAQSWMRNYVSICGVWEVTASGHMGWWWLLKWMDTTNCEGGSIAASQHRIAVLFRPRIEDSKLLRWLLSISSPTKPYLQSLRQNCTEHVPSLHIVAFVVILAVSCM